MKIFNILLIYATRDSMYIGYQQHGKNFRHISALLSKLLGYIPFILVFL